LDRDQLDRAFRRLPIDQRIVVVLRHYLDLSAAEVAETPGIPLGTVASRLHYAIRGPGFAGLTFGNVDAVYADGCHWNQPRLAPGRGVDELESVLAPWPLRNVTTRVDVTRAGSSGTYMVWSVPDDMNFADCDVESSDGVHDFESWTAWIVGGDRYEQGPGQVDELWILDLDGQRLVIDATHVPETSMADVAELHSILRTIRFE